MIHIADKQCVIRTVALIGWLFSSAVVCAESKVGILIPELREPFNAIFNSIADGVDQGVGQRSSRLALEKDFDPKDIERWLLSENIEAVVTLGSLGKKAAIYIPNSTPIVHGALTSAPGSSIRHYGIMLTPNPRDMFQQLQQIDNKRKEIVVVYNPLKYQWLIELAKRQAAENQVRLVEYKATDLKQAAIIYNQILRGNGHEERALWLMHDRSVVDSKIILPFILEKSWQKNMVVFSSSVGHVKKGVLFSMYPDNVLHGKQAANILLKEIAENTPTEKKLFPTEGLLKAINSRTAEHLGLDISQSDLRKFDVVFPVSN